MAKLASALLVIIIVLSAVAISPTAIADEQNCSPENELVYDEFRYDNETISEFENGGKATVSKQNTQVTVDADEAFIRLNIENANTYCTKFTIELSEDVATAATLGAVDDTDGTTTADWRATHDFDEGDTYTEITVTVPAETRVTFAPSQIRVKSLSWTSTAEEMGIGERIADAVGLGNDFEQRIHPIEGNESEKVSVPLTNPDDPNTSIDNWQATYTTDDGNEKRVLSKDSGDPVFYRTVDDGDAIEIVYNEPATVEFNADPTVGDRVRYETTSFMSSLNDAINVPFLSVPMGVI